MTAANIATSLVGKNLLFLISILIFSERAVSFHFYFVSFHSAGGARQIGISDMYNLKSCKYGQRAGGEAAEGRSPARLTPVGLFSLLFSDSIFI